MPGQCWHDLEKAFIPKPGGDKIGRRRLDTHINGFKKLGVKFLYDSRDAFFHLSGKLKGTYLLLDEPSVTGTANLLMAAVRAEGSTTIYNAACEPYIPATLQNACCNGSTDQRGWQQYACGKWSNKIEWH